jgi:hypothetical protein
MIYEAIDKETGEILAAFEAPTDDRAGFRLRFELKDEGQAAGAANIRLRRAPDPAVYPHIKPAMFDWLPKREVPHA